MNNKIKNINLANCCCFLHYKNLIHKHVILLEIEDKQNLTECWTNINIVIGQTLYGQIRFWRKRTFTLLLLKRKNKKEQGDYTQPF